MNTDELLNKLGDIAPVDAPPFLFTRIKARLAAPLYDNASPQWRWIFVAGAVVVMTLNIAVWSMAFKQKPTETMDEITEGMHLTYQNNLYHE